MITLFCIRPKGFNIGNDLIFLGTQQFIQEAFGCVVNTISLPATSRYESQAKAGLTAKTVYEINQYGHGVIIGGGNLYENGELDVSLDALEALEVPLMLLSLSRGRVYNRHYKMVDRTDAMPARMVLALNQKAKYSLARDQATVSFLHSIGCLHPQLGGCPSLFVDRIIDRLPRVSPLDQGGVLISVRNPTLMSIPLQKQSQVYDDTTGIIDFFRQQGFVNIRLLCHDHRDIPFAASIAGIDYIYTEDVYMYLALLRSCTLNVSYRLHSALPCLAFRTPTINMSYDERALTMMETIGLGTWNINMIESDDVVAAVADRYHRLGELQVLRTQTQPLWEELAVVTKRALRSFAEDVQAYYHESCSIQKRL